MQAWPSTQNQLLTFLASGPRSYFLTHGLESALVLAKAGKQNGQVSFSLNGRAAFDVDRQS